MVAFICIWWFAAKSYREDFIVPAPYMVMVGMTSIGDVYYADIDVPMSPKWIYSANGKTATDIAGSYGKLHILNSSGVYVYPYDASTPTSINTPSLERMAIDDAGILGGITSSGEVVYGGSTNSTTLMSSVSFSGGAAYAVGKDSNLYYSGTPGRGIWTNTTPSGTAGTWLQVSFDGAVCAIQKTGQLWSADANIGNASANWTRQGSKLFSHICLKGGRLIGVGFSNKGSGSGSASTDTGTYYSNTYSSPSWTQLSLKTYDNTGAPKPATPTLTKVIMFYPALDARRKRFLGSAGACNPDEQQIGKFCYGACASGRVPQGASCPYRKLHVPAIPSCDNGSEFINGSCYKPCPAGYQTSGEKCLGITTDRGGSRARDFKLVSPAKYNCPADGTIQARYVRIRPTTLVTNNRLCISKLVVKGANGEIFSLPSGMPTVISEIGTITGTGVFSNTKSIPIIAIKTLAGGSGSGSGSSSPLKIYVAQNSAGGTVMIGGGTAKTVAGSPYSWTDSYWLNGTASSAGAYVLNLNTKPVKTYATDGTCIDAPIGGSSCGTYSSYVSGATYNGEADGGQGSRAGKLYWEVDLGMLQKIKTIEFTGCDYLAPTVTAAGVAAESVSQPNQDQITGMRVELLYSVNEPNTVPLVSRTLGPKTSQVITFNYVGREPLVENRCYDDCPPVNGIPTGYGGDGTCVSASGGITSRSVTSPLPLPDPVCSIPKNDDGTPYTLPTTGSSGNIGGWVIDPTNSKNTLTCSHFPGSVLTPLTNKYYIPNAGTTNSFRQETYQLQDTGNTPYINSETANMCVKFDDSVCAAYNTGGKEYWYISGQCIRIDIQPGFPTAGASYNLLWGQDWWSNGHGWHLKYSIKGANHVYDYSTGKDMTDDFKIPLIPQANAKAPKVIPSNCKCLNADGTINKQAYIYNNKCIKCSSPSDVFFARGASSSSYNWSAEKKNTWISLYSTNSNGATTLVDAGNHQYINIQDAKDACEANDTCGGITKTYDAGENPFYSLRGCKIGTVCVGYSTADEASGSKGSGIDRMNVTPNDSSWVKLGAGSQKAVPSDQLHSGMSYSSSDIPRSFADDYVGSFGKVTPPRSFDLMNGSSKSFDIMQLLDSSVLQAQSAWTSFQNSVQNNTYYQLVGVERMLYKDQVSPDFGICVGPCDTPHHYHDPIQLLYDAAAAGTTSPAYILYGTTCHDPTMKSFAKPSIPADYTPQNGSLCDDNYEASGGKCIAQCDSNSTQTATSCTTQPTPRPFSAPTYVCPPNLTKLDTVCVSPCGPGFTEDGDFCQPVVSAAALPSTINCTRTDYGFAAGSSTGKVNKWLCESFDDVSSLVKGSVTYTQKDDIVCYADDPTTGMYYCSSIDDFKNGVEDSGRTDLATSCDTLTKSYFDLSDNLTILKDAQTSSTTVAGQVNAIEQTLKAVIAQVCATSGSTGTACTNLNTYLLALQSNIASGGGSSILSPINVGLQSRDALIKILKEYQCCSLHPGQTDYPWC